MPKGKPKDPKLESNIVSAMNGQAIQPLVYQPPQQRINGKRSHLSVRYDDVKVDIKGEIVRIKQEADPTGFLIAVVTGAAFVTRFIDEHGNIQERLEFPSLSQRIKVATHLASTYMPKLGVVKHVIPGDPNAGERQDGKPSFAQLVELAASSFEVGEDDGDQPRETAGSGEAEQGTGGDERPPGGEPEDVR